MATLPRSFALCLRCMPNNCQSCCLVKFTLVDPLEPPKANISSPTLQPMKEMWLVMSLPLCAPLQEVNVIYHQCSSTGGTKTGFFMTPLEPPKANISSPTLQPMREMWLVMSLPLCAPLQEVNVIHHQCSSTGGTKTGFFMTTPE